MHARRRSAVEHDDVIADERSQPLLRVIGQRRTPDVQVVPTGIDERHGLERSRPGPVLLDVRQPLAEWSTPHGVDRDERPTRQPKERVTATDAATEDTASPVHSRG